MTQAEIKRGYYDSMNRFTNIDGEKFGACMKQVFDLKHDVCIEWRIRKADTTLCIIQYYEQGRGYTIFEQENY